MLALALISWTVAVLDCSLTRAAGTGSLGISPPAPQHGSLGPPTTAVGGRCATTLAEPFLERLETGCQLAPLRRVCF
jgi:hypothetical protein